MDLAATKSWSVTARFFAAVALGVTMITLAQTNLASSTPIPSGHIDAVLPSAGSPQNGAIAFLATSRVRSFVREVSQSAAGSPRGQSIKTKMD